MSEYALILEENPTRAAQYARMVEMAELVPTSARSAEEATFHISRLGTPRLVIIELAAPGDSQLQFLRDLRHLASAGTGAPVVAIVDSRAMYEQAARHMIELNIVALLTRSHNLSAVDRAIRVTLSKPLAVPGAWNDATRPPSQPQALRGGAKSAPPPQDDEDPLVIAERLAENPLVERLAHLRVLDKGTSVADLTRLVADTATVFQVPMALIWLDRSGRTAFAAHPRLENDAALREGGGPWAAFRDALGDVPLHVADTTQHRLLQRNPLVRDGAVRCYAGAPLRDGEGNIAGAICIAHQRVGAIAPELLDPLVFWSLRIGTELLPVHPAVPSPHDLPREPVSGPVQVSGGRGFVAALETGVILTDAHGTVTYANPQAGLLLRLKGRLRGLRRNDLIGLVGVSTDAQDAVLREIDSASIVSRPQSFELSFRSPVRRVLRWRTGPLKLGDANGRLDEITDVTQESAAAEDREKLVRIDALTGLPNRRGGEDALGREISRCLRTGAPLSVALFEIGSLDVFEPKVADQVVRAMAWLLRDALRGYDLAVRYSRRHLLAVLPGVTATQMVSFAERYRGAVERTSIEGLPRVTISGGIAEFEPAKDADRLMADAAAALSDARKQGGNRVI